VGTKSHISTFHINILGQTVQLRESAWPLFKFRVVDKIPSSVNVLVFVPAVPNF